jgi:hypothetical protein
MDSEFPVITICGSMRFYSFMLSAARELSLQGWIVLMPYVIFPTKQQGEKAKSKLDSMHLRKIDLSSAICLVTDNVNYIGESTQREMDYATDRGKQLFIFRNGTLRAKGSLIGKAEGNAKT